MTDTSSPGNVSRTSIRLYRWGRAGVLSAWICAGLPQAAVAGPEGGAVVAGEGAIVAPNGSTTVIEQTSQRLALDWQSFDIQTHELVQFRQPGAQAEALNRIFDQDGTQILGRLEANGRVILANPNGVFFGPNARVNVNSLVAAGLQVKVEDFLAGRISLSGVEGAPGDVINQGTLAAATGGDVTLAGKHVRNEGLIVANAGRVNLLAGERMTLDFEGDGLLRFTVDEAVLENPTDAPDAVHNSGVIEAPGGTVVLAAKTAREVFDNAINNSGIVRAGRIARDGGAIKLLGLGTDDTVINSGELNASGDAAHVGGRIEVVGASVEIADGSELNASGGQGGGEILLGGGAHGAPIEGLTAQRTQVSANTTVAANATHQGDGGHIVIWAEDHAALHGSVAAKGGQQGGNGGAVELSARDEVILTHHVDLTALRGAFGHLLIDPGLVTVQDGLDDGSNIGPNIFNDAFLITQLGLGDVTLDTSAATAGNSDIVFNNDVDITWNAATALQLLAGRNVTLSGVLNGLNGDLSITFGSDGGGGTLDFTGANVAVDSLTVTGGAGTDIVDFGNATVALTANSSIAGGGGNDTFDFSTVGSFTNTANTDIDGVAGTDTLIGSSGANAFVVTSANQGTLTFGATTIDFANLVNLTGGDNVDTFTLNASLSGAIDARDGNDTVTLVGASAFGSMVGGNGTDTLIGGNTVNNWTISGTDAGSLNGAAFSSVQNVTGGTGSDTFTLSAGLSGNLAGGNGVNTFVVQSAGSIGGALTGGTGVDTLSFAGNGAAISINLGSATATAIGTTFSSIDSFIGNNSDSTLIGTSGSESFSLTGTNDGSIGALSFTDFTSLDGSGGTDSLSIASAGANRTLSLQDRTVAGVLSGTFASFEAFVGDNATSTLVLTDAGGTLATTGANSGSYAGFNFTDFVNITAGANAVTFQINHDLTGTVLGSAANDSFTLGAGVNVGLLDGNGGANALAAANAANAWLITASNGGTLNGESFSNMQQLTGGTLVDTFTFSDGVSVTALDGGAGIDVLNLNAYSTGRTFNLTGAAAGNINSPSFAFAGIDSVSGTNANDSFAIDVNWAGSLAGHGGSDAFVFANGVTVTGSIDGGTGTDTLNWSVVNSARSVVLSGLGPTDGFAGDESSITTGTFTNIDSLIGGTATDSFTGINATAQFALDGTPQYISTNTLDFSGFENLSGGTGADTFNLTGALANATPTTIFTGTLNGGDGLDQFNFVNNARLSGEIQGGNDSDTISVASSTLTAGQLKRKGNGTGEADPWIDFGSEGAANSSDDFGGIETALGAPLIVQGDNVATVWSITGLGAVTNVTTGDSFTNVASLIGGTNIDTITVQSGGRLIGATGIDGGGGADILIAGAAANFVLTGLNAGTLTIAGAATTFTAMPTLTGSGALDSLTGANTTNTWTLSGTDAGTVTNLTGSFSLIEALVGGSGTDTLIGDNVTRSWAVTGSNAGTVSALGTGFSQMENLTGGTGNDDFVLTANLSGALSGGNGTNSYSLQAGGSVTGAITGGSGADTLSFSANTSVAMSSNSAGTATNTGGFTGIEAVNGGGVNDTLTGTNPSTFSVTSNFNGTLNAVLTFTGFENLRGGAGNDSFTFADNVIVSSVDGLGGNDTLSLAAYLLGQTFAFANTDNAGNVNGVAFASTENITAGNGADIFDFNGSGRVTGTFDAGGGADIADFTNAAGSVTFDLASALNFETLQGSANVDTLVGTGGADNFVINAANSGTHNGTLVFAAIESLSGGLGADSFVFNDGGSLTGSIDGGGASDSINFAAVLANVFVNLQTTAVTAGVSLLGSFTALETIIGGGNDTLQGDNTANTFTVTGLDDGTVDTFTFVDFANLSAGSAGDSFVLNGGTLSGALSGGAGADTLTAANVINAWVINAVNAGTVTGIGGGFAGVENVVGGSQTDTFDLQGSISGSLNGAGGVDTLNFFADTTIVLSAANAGSATGLGSGFSAVESVTGTGAADILTGSGANETFNVSANFNGTLGSLAFTGFETLRGGAGNDSFVFGNGLRVNAVDGELGTDTLSLAAYTTPQTFLFGAANDAGTVNGMTFVSTENVTAGSAGDVFDFDGAGRITGTLDAGSGIDVMDFASLTSAISFTVGLLPSIEQVIGSAASDTLVGSAGADFIVSSGANAGCLPDCTAPTLTFSSFENLDGAGGNDVFALPHSFSGNVLGGAGDDTFLIINTVSFASLDGGADNDLVRLGQRVAAGDAADIDAIVTTALVGGTGNDTFQFRSASRLIGALQGSTANSPVGADENGTLGIDTLDMRQSTLVQDVDALGVGSSGFGMSGSVRSVTLGGVDMLSAGYDNLDDINGNSLGTLIGNQNAPNVWTVTGTNSGTLNGVGFSNFSLLGGNDVDTFTFGANGQLTQGLDGGIGGIDTVIAAPGGSVFVLNAANGGTIDPDGALATPATAFSRIDQVNGGAGNDRFQLTNTAFAGTVDGAGGTDTLEGGNFQTTWTLTGAAAGSVSVLPAGFTSIEQIVGGSADDTFTLGAIAFAGALDGGGGSNVLQGANVSNVWNLLGIRSGNVGGANTFTNIGELRGGSATDQFLFNLGALFDRIDGGNGSDTLNYAALPTAVTIDLRTQTASLLLNSFSGIETSLGSSALDSLQAADTQNNWNLTGPGQGNVNGFGFSSFEQLLGGSAGDLFSFASNGQITTGVLDGGGGQDRILNTATTHLWEIDGTNTGFINNARFVDVEELDAGAGSATLTFTAPGSLTGFFSAGSIALNSAAVDTGGIALDLRANVTSVASNVSTGAGSFRVGGNLLTNGAFSLAANEISVGAAITANNALNLTSNAALTVAGALNAVGQAVALNGNAITLGGAVNAGSLNVTGGLFANNTITTTGAQSYAGAQRFVADLTASAFAFSGTTTFSGDVSLRSSNDLLAFNGQVDGAGSLTLNPTLGRDLVFDGAAGAGHYNPAAFANYRGHLIVGGVLDPTTPPAEEAEVVAINANRITVAEALRSLGSVTLLASNIDLLADMAAGPGVGGQITLLAVGDSQLTGDGPGNITAGGAGLVTLSADSAVLIANNQIANNANIVLDLNGGPVLVAVASGEDEPTFDPSSNATSQTFDPNLLPLIASLTNPLAVQAVQVIFSNPAAALTGLQNVQFIDLTLFEEELNLFSVIGNGIAQSLDQCEDLEGCAPNVTATELDTLIGRLERRIAELEGVDRAEVNAVLARYRTQLADFQAQRAALIEYQEAEEASEAPFDDLESTEFTAEPLPEEDLEAAPLAAEPAPDAAAEESFEELEIEQQLPAELPAVEGFDDEATPEGPVDGFDELNEDTLDEPAIDDPFLVPGPEDVPGEDLEEFEELEEEFEPLSLGPDLQPARETGFLAKN